MHERIRRNGLAILLTLVMVVSFMPVMSTTVHAADPTTLKTVDFETAGSGYTVTGEIAPNTSYCWARTDGSVISPDTSFSGKQGTYYFYGENTDGTSGNTQTPVYLTLESINVTGYTNLQIKILVAGNNSAGSAYEGGEYLKLQYSYDGGGYITKSQFIPSAVDIIYLTEDADANGTVDGANLSPAFTEFTYNIPAGGTNLSIRIEANIDQGSEEVGFDNIRIIGTEAPADTTAPTLQSAVQDSNTQITVTLSEASQNLVKANNGGFTVHETGNPGTTYAVSATAQGGDNSHVVLTVADLGVSAAEGLTVTYTAGGNGTIADLAGNALATNGVGVTISAWDTTAPTVSSINRQSPAGASTNATSVIYRVTFNEAVSGVDTTDFTLTTTGSATGAIASVSSASGTTMDVTVNNITGTGTLRLDLKAAGTGIVDVGGTAIVTGYTSGQTYTVDTAAPTLQSAVRDNNTQITVTLSEASQNLIKANDGGFTVFETGAPGTTYAVSTTAQGADTSHVVLTVADLGISAAEGLTVTYTAGGNGTIADLAGNTLATNGVGVTIAAWDTTAPAVSSINRQTPAGASTNANSVTYRVTFSEVISGVDTSDFTLTTTGSAAGSIASVSAASGTTIDVTVNTITGVGTLRLDLKAAGTGITDIGGTAIATGYTSGQTYTVDTTAPTLQSAVRDNNIQITVTLSEASQNLIKPNNGGFTVSETGTPGTTYAVSATAQGVDTSHVVLTVADLGASAAEGLTVTYTAGGNGTIADLAGNALATNGVGVTISAWDTTAPTVSSINRQSPAGASTNATSVTYRVTFSEAVSGVDTSDFTLTTTGSAAGAISSVSSASGTTMDVTVNTITGTGTLRLDLNAAGTGIADVGGTAIATGYTSGQTYTVDTTAPTLQSAVRDSNTQITVTLSEASQNLIKANSGGFTVFETGAPGTTYAVSATAQGGDTSHVVLTVADLGASAAEGLTVTYTAGGNGTIQDLAGNALVTDGVGVTIAAWDTTAPTVSSINRLTPAGASTNATSVTYRVTFNEAVNGVDITDFTLTTTGSAAGTIASVSAASGTTIDVTVNTITGTGTLRLDLNAAGTGIVDVGGTAIATGYTSGQTYTVDTTAPTLQSAVRDSNTQITVSLSEASQNLIKANDGGFTVYETGAPGTTYAVSTTAQGADTSHVVLTVADLGVSAAEGLTVTYTAGGNGTIADLAGNALATNGVGVTIAAWDTTAPTVSSINRLTPAGASTNATSVTYRVTFSEAVSGVNTTDFTLTTTGSATGTIASVSAASGTTIDVTVGTITGTGTLRLDLNAAGTGIADVGGIAIATGYTSGQTYTIDPNAGGSSGGGSSTGDTTTQPNQDTVVVIVNGKEQDAGKETKTTEDGRTTVTVEVNNTVIESKIDEAIQNNTTGEDNVIQVPVADTKSEVVKVELTGDIVKKLEQNNFDVSVKRDNVEYVIPAEEFTISKVAENLGVKEDDLVDIKVEVKITKLDENVIKKYNEVANANGAELVFPPVSFEVVAKTTQANGSTGEVGINKFNNYVERVMEIPAGVDPSKITTGIVFNANGTYSHVPTEVFEMNGKWYAKLNSLTNSNYSVIWNPITVKSVENHWAKEAVNDLASRLIIFDSDHFEPNQAITRADFAEYIVRALGLYREGSTVENHFSDVRNTGERTLAILIANEYGIVTGYPDGTFKPEQEITREEAMAMYQRAMKITKLSGSDTTRYQDFTDYGSVSGWATLYVREVLSAHVFNGTSATTISPKSKLTYAEAAQAIRNLLVESNLINQ